MIFSLIAPLIIVADQLTKSWVRSFPEGQVIYQNSIFQFVHLRNSGAAFGIFPGQSIVLMIVASISAIFLLVYVFVLPRYHLPVINNRVTRALAGVIFGGVAGNLIDRFRFGGYVTDFIDFRFWPAFNIADSSVVVGVIAFMVYIIIKYR